MKWCKIQFLRDLLPKASRSFYVLIQWMSMLLNSWRNLRRSNWPTFLCQDFRFLLMRRKNKSRRNWLSITSLWLSGSRMFWKKMLRMFRSNFMTKRSQWLFFRLIKVTLLICKTFLSISLRCLKRRERCNSVNRRKLLLLIPTIHLLRSFLIGFKVVPIKTLRIT